VPTLHEAGRLEEIERRTDPKRRYADLAIRFRVIETGEILPKKGVIGGRWDRLKKAWVKDPKNLKVVEWSIQAQQVELLLGLAPALIFVAIFAGRQAGKTYAAVSQVIVDALRYPGRKSAIISLNYKASRDPERTFRSLLDPRWGVRRNKTDREYIFPNGHVVVFLSVEAIDTARGPSLKTILMDEASRASHEDFVTAIGCGAASKDFRIYLATTPKRESVWCREVDATWGRTVPDSKIIRLETRRNPRRNLKLLKAIEESLPADLVDQEFRGVILPPENAAYADLFRRPLHVRKAGDLPEPIQFRLDRGPSGKPLVVDYTAQWVWENFRVKDAEYVAGWDFGKEAVVAAKIYRDTRSIYDAKGRRRLIHRDRLWIVEEFVNFNTTTEHHAAAVIKRRGKRIFVVHDAMGAHERSDGRGQDGASADSLERAGFIGVEAVGTRNPGVRHRVKTVNHALLAAPPTSSEDAWLIDEWPGEAEWPAGEVTLFVDPSCKKLIDALENQKMINGKPEKDEKHEHVADALGYLVCAVLPIEPDLPAGMQRVGGKG
jgi:hypothetical protein